MLANVPEAVLAVATAAALVAVQGSAMVVVAVLVTAVAWEALHQVFGNYCLLMPLV